MDKVKKSTKQKKKAPSKKALNRRKDRRFLTVALPLVSLLTVGLLVLFMHWENQKGSIYREQAYAAIAAGDMEKARTLAKKGEDAGEEGLQQEVEYAYGEALLSRGEYETAREIFLSLGAYGNAPTRALECRYRQGEALYNAENYTEAEAAFREATGYEDALSRLDDCRYQQALQALEAGDKSLALELFAGLGSYQDAQEQAKALSLELTGQEDAQKALALEQGVTEEEWQAMEEVATLQSERREGVIAAGESHALGVTGDKTVVSAGDNTYGQCNTQSWSSVTNLAAGSRHSLALTEEGRVLSTGDNTYGQCDTAGWTNIVAIAAGNFDSYGLTDEGKILHCGYADMDSISTWQGISALSAGNSVLAALRTDGTFLCTTASGQHEDWKNLTDVAINVGWVAGLTREGKVLCEEFDLSGWSNVLALYQSETLLVGLKQDGTVYAHPLRPWVSSLCTQLESLTDVSDLALAGSWVLCLHTDGTLTLIGDAPVNCATWKLKAPTVQ